VGRQPTIKINETVST